MTIIQKKICILGDFAVGKTSLINRFVEGRFNDKYLGTIGVKVSRKTLSRPYGQINMLLWDMTGGDEIGSPARSSYLRGASGALIVCDLTRKETLSIFERHARQMLLLNPRTALVYIGNKVDLITERAISDRDMSELCGRLGSSMYFLSSAKTGANVDEAFLHLAALIEAQG